MKQQIDWNMPEGAWTDAQKNLYTKRIKWIRNQYLSLAGSRFDEWYDEISERDMVLYVDAVAFAVHTFLNYQINIYPNDGLIRFPKLKIVSEDLPMSIHHMNEVTGIGLWWGFGINVETVCEINSIGKYCVIGRIGIQSVILDLYRRKLLSRVYASKTHADWIALAKEMHGD